MHSMALSLARRQRLCLLPQGALPALRTWLMSADRAKMRSSYTSALPVSARAGHVESWKRRHPTAQRWQLGNKLLLWGLPRRCILLEACTPLHTACCTQRRGTHICGLAAGQLHRHRLSPQPDAFSLRQPGVPHTKPLICTRRWRQRQTTAGSRSLLCEHVTLQLGVNSGELLAMPFRHGQPTSACLPARSTHRSPRPLAG